MGRRNQNTGRKYPPRNINMTGTIPDREGIYDWTEWGIVKVYAKHKRAGLYVTPPGGVEIRVSEKIAGLFRYIGPLENKA